ncbi:hypothetical protein NW062_01220 [Mycoplasmopsis cynos]|nr:hypothetical protein NW062_01220 [Mycoplasmopsis cynos]
MKRLVSGIKPTGNLTLGNYIGAIRNFIKMQDDYESYIFVADLHALTTEKIKPSELKKQRESIIALYVFMRIRLSKKCNFLSITSSSTYAIMQWLCCCETTLGELKRMTQFKDKSLKLKQGNGTEKIPTGLLMYPTLLLEISCYIILMLCRLVKIKYNI